MSDKIKKGMVIPLVCTHCGKQLKYKAKKNEVEGERKKECPHCGKTVLVNKGRKERKQRIKDNDKPDGFFTYKTSDDN